MTDHHAAARAAADAWNRVNAEDAPVRYWLGEREGQGRESRTRGPAWALPSGTAVVNVEGHAGGVALTHVEPIDRGPLRYHHLHITCPSIPRTSIFNVPYEVEVTCTRVAGWQVWRANPDGADRYDGTLLGAEFDEKWLVFDVDGHVIVDSRPAGSDVAVLAIHAPLEVLADAEDCRAGSHETAWRTDDDGDPVCPVCAPQRVVCAECRDEQGARVVDWPCRTAVAAGAPVPS